jgi:hypothetical protein
LAINIGAHFSLYAQDRGMTTPDVQQSNARVALVIGNGAYQLSPLKNPTNDARAVALALKNTRFTVYDYSNLT